MTKTTHTRLRETIGRAFALLLGIAFVSPASAAIVEAGYAGTIAEIDPTLAAALPPESPIAVGASLVVNYAYESTTPDSEPDPASGIYTGAITSFTIYIDSQTFDFVPAGPKNEIDVLVDAFLNIYQPVASVTADPPLPIVANLEGDVIFLAVNSNPLSDDSLIVPPSPTDPQWDSAAAAITDDANNTLIQAEIDQQCVGPCPVPNVNPPVPVGAPGLLALALGAIGAALVCRRGRG